MEMVRMQGRDAISAPLAECYIILDGIQYNFMQAINLEARMTKTKIEVPILGSVNKGHKSGGMNGTGSATFHFNSSVFRKLMHQYQETGEDFYFDIQITNEDRTTRVGRQTIILRDVNLDSVIVAKFDADGEYLDEDMDFTFERFDMPEEFTPLTGMY